jgi:hypothetical protein
MPAAAARHARQRRRSQPLFAQACCRDYDSPRQRSKKTYGASRQRYRWRRFIDFSSLRRLFYGFLSDTPIRLQLPLLAGYFH